MPILQTAGLDLLLAWTIFVVLLVTPAYFVVRRRSGPAGKIRSGEGGRRHRDDR
jgi:hypothetical protein